MELITVMRGVGRPAKKPWALPTTPTATGAIRTISREPFKGNISISASDECKVAITASSPATTTPTLVVTPPSGRLAVARSSRVLLTASATLLDAVGVAATDVEMWYGDDDEDFKVWVDVRDQV